MGYTFVVINIMRALWWSSWPGAALSLLLSLTGSCMMVWSLGYIQFMPRGSRKCHFVSSENSLIQQRWKLVHVYFSSVTPLRNRWGFFHVLSLKALEQLSLGCSQCAPLLMLYMSLPCVLNDIFSSQFLDSPSKQITWTSDHILNSLVIRYIKNSLQISLTCWFIFFSTTSSSTLDLWEH